MSDSVIVGLTLAVVGGAGMASAGLYAAWQGRIDRDRYKLFALRDRLYWLVIKKEVAETDYAYKMIYWTINSIVADVTKFTIYDYAKSFVRESRSLETSEYRDAFLAALQDAPEVLQQVAVDFYQTSLDIMWRNSLELRLLVAIRNAVRRMGARLPAVFPRPVIYAAYLLGEMWLSSTKEASKREDSYYRTALGH